MANQKFSIQKKIFEVESFSSQHVHELQNKISRLVNYRLTQQMENYFGEVIPESLLLRMDQLVLDIGEVSWDSLEEEIEERVLRQLENEFSLRLQLLKDVNNSSHSGISIETILTGKLELFEYFLINGVLPWYSDSTGNFSIDDLLNLLYDSGRADLSAIIKRAGKNENVRRRISYQFSEESIKKLVHTLEPANAEYIFQTHKEITKLQKDKQIVHTEAKEFDKAIWLFMMNYLLIEMSSEFSRKMFVKSNLAQIGHYFNISYLYMLDIFHKALEFEKSHLYAPLQSVINELFADDTQFIQGKKPPGKIAQEPLPDTETFVSNIELLQYYFRFGTLPYTWQKIDKDIFAGILLQVAKAAPLTVRNILFASAGDGGFLRLQLVLGESQIKDLVKLIFIENETELRQVAAAFEAIHEIEEPFTAVQLNDVLQYLLLNGNIPWWGREFYGYPVAHMIRELYAAEPKAMALLLRRAALHPQMKERLLLNIPMPIAHALLQELPGGKEASVSFNQFVMLLDKSELMRYHDEAFVQKTIFSIAWDVLAKTGYALFSGIIFYIESILRLSAVLHIYPEVFVVKLMQSSVKIPDTGVFHKIPVLLYAAQNYFYELKKKNTGTVDILPGHQENPKDFTPKKDTGEKPPEDVVLPESDVLYFYLHWNRLPDSFGTMEAAERQKILRELILMVFLKNQVFLKTLLNDESNSIIAQMSLSELFSESEGGNEKRMSIYLLQNTLPQLKKISAEKQYTIDFQLLGTGSNLLNLADIFCSEEIIDEKKITTIIHERSRKTLEYFLRYNRLPDNIDVDGAGKKDRLLLSLMVLLFTSDPAFTREQFQKPGLSIAAKLHLYDLVAMGNDIVTDRVFRLMEEWFEKDLVQMLSETGHLSNEDTVSFLKNILQNTRAKEKPEEIERLLSSSSFAKMILNKYGFSLFFKIAAHRIKWSPTGDSIIRGWLNFIQNTIPQSPRKDKIIDLFKRFNIAFISGALDIYSNDSYTIALIKYLFAYADAGDVVIYKILLEHAASAKGPIAGLHHQKKLIQRLLLPVFLQLEEKQLTDQLTKKNEDRNLSAAIKEEIAEYRERQSAIFKNEARHKSKREEEEEQKNYNKFPEDNSESIYIANAGLVLFHPFVETYFSRVGLMQKGRFIDIESRNRAVLLLQYLANGKTTHEEHELVLNKILCNVPVTEPIPVVFDLTEQEIDVSAELFRVFIERWPKMKNSSADGLRASFILREGMLKIIDGNWSMKVEQKGYDILLQSYPWAFGYVKTPWMQHTLLVEWI